MNEAFDLLVSGGTIIDGTGAPRFDADIGVRNGRIAFIGEATDAGTAALAVQSSTPASAELKK